MILLPFYAAYGILACVVLFISLVFKLVWFLVTLPFLGYRRHLRVRRAQRRRLRL
jgi:hypothetical protein